MRVVFMGSAELCVPTLELLIRGEHVVAVYTQPDRPAGRGRAPTFSPVKRVALEHGLEVLQHASFKEPGAVELLAELSPDVIVVAAFGIILPPEVLGIPPFGCINLHPSLLPRHRGPSPVQGAILAGDERTGVTIMLMDVGIDTGPILAQRMVAIEPGDNAGSLTERLAQIGAQLLEETLPLWFSRTIVPRPQPDEGATYTTLLSKADGEMNWLHSAVMLGRQVRAFHPWPGCYTWWQGRALKVLEAAPLPGGGGRLGEVVSLEGDVVGVQTGDGVLQLMRVQLEGRREMSAAEFARGQRTFIGSILPC